MAVPKPPPAYGAGHHFWLSHYCQAYTEAANLAFPTLRGFAKLHSFPRLVVGGGVFSTVHFIPFTSWLGTWSWQEEARAGYGKFAILSAWLMLEGVMDQGSGPCCLLALSESLTVPLPLPPW